MVVMRVRGVADEAPVDLEDVHRVLVQVGQRGVAGSEVVDRDVDTHGGQLGFGQAGMSGGFSQLIEGVTQVRGECGESQVRRCDTAYVTGTGGIMSEQAALVLQGG